MKRVIFLALMTSLASCSGVDVSESTGESREALNGDLSPQGFLKVKNLATTDESTRRTETTSYYYVNAAVDSQDPAGSVNSRLSTLTDFRSRLGFGTGIPEARAFYYNKADLGLGREMHCVDRFAIDQQIACYVTNYIAGDDLTEFAFGLSRDIAFANMSAQHPIATVAMLFQGLHSRHGKIHFIVYNAQGGIANNAPLDRHGFVFANIFNLAALFTGGGPGSNPDPALFGTPGVNFNNQIPTNCLNCHGGVYHPQGEINQDGNVTNAYVEGGLFLPWDLDQLEFSTTPGQTRTDQESEFRKLNEMARKVAFNSDLPGTTAPGNHPAGLASPVVQQIDKWYNNTSHSQTLSGVFHSNATATSPNGIPDGWNGSAADRSLYYNVVRRSCRGCHITSSIQQLTFSDAATFRQSASTIAADVASHRMPHSLQAQREFWFSSQPAELENYLSTTDQAAANVLHGAGPGRIITLDPPQIAAVTAF